MGDPAAQVRCEIGMPFVVLSRWSAAHAVGEDRLQPVEFAAGDADLLVHHHAADALLLAVADHLSFRQLHTKPLLPDQLHHERDEHAEAAQELVRARKREVVGVARVVRVKRACQSGEPQVEHERRQVRERG